MRLVIHKYPFRVPDGLMSSQFTLDLPTARRILHVDYQQYVGPFLWVAVDLDLPTEPVMFRIYGTGVEMDAAFINEANYIGTFFEGYQGHQGRYVWHVFQERTKDEKVRKWTEDYSRVMR